jgi:hypothetical protein
MVDEPVVDDLGDGRAAFLAKADGLLDVSRFQKFSDSTKNVVAFGVGVPEIPPALKHEGK